MKKLTVFKKASLQATIAIYVAVLTAVACAGCGISYAVSKNLGIGFGTASVGWWVCCWLLFTALAVYMVILVHKDWEANDPFYYKYNKRHKKTSNLPTPWL